MRLHPPLGLEIAAARGVAALSRRLGAGGGTTIPGKLLAELDRSAIDRLAARLVAGTAVVSATNGKTTTTAMAAEILRPRHRLAHNAAGANIVSRADDPQLAAVSEARPGSVAFGLDDPRVARPSLQHAADSKYCIRCGTPYDYAAAYVRPLAEYRCPRGHHERPPLDVLARDISLRGLESTSFLLVAPEGSREITLRLPGLYNVYNAIAAAALARALGSGLDEIAAGLERFSAAFGRFERVPVGDKGILLLLIKNPAGANEAIRTLVDGAAPSLLVVALNDEIADGRDVSWIWDVDFEPLLPGLDRLIASGGRAAELALRFRYGDLDEDAIELVPDLEGALDRGLALTPPGGELVLLPTYTAMLGLQQLLAARGLTRPYWERSA